MNPYTVSIQTIGETTATVTIVVDAILPTPSDTLSLKFIPTSGTTVSQVLPTQVPGTTVNVSVTGLTAGTEYTVGVYDGTSLASNEVTTITTGGVGVTATRSQWADLVDRIKQSEANVQSDWSQTNTSADDYIKNKPTIPSILITSTDPGEGTTLAANNFIGVYDA